MNNIPVIYYIPSGQCCARTFDPVKHLDNKGNLLIMRPDVYNLYGDLCNSYVPFSKQFFCSDHMYTQSLGVWNGLYASSLKYHLEKVPYDHLSLLN